MAAASNYIGYLGVLLILAAYFLSNAGKINYESYFYGALNLVGAALLLYSLYFHWNWPSVVIELAWMSISVYGIGLVLRRRLARRNGA